MEARKTIEVDSELFDKLAEEARAENRTADEVATTALQRYLIHRHMKQMVRYGRRRAEALGIKEGDVERLIDEERQQQRER